MIPVPGFNFAHSMKKIFLGLGLILAFNAAQAQKYRTALGVRASRNQLGLTVQQLILPKSTIEVIASAGSNEYSGTALFEHHFPILGRGFNYYLGAGAHLGDKKDFGKFYGADLITGLELKTPLLPFTISADLKPAFHVNHGDWFTFGGGISARFILVKEKKKKFNLFGPGENKKDSGGIFGPRKDAEKTKTKTKSWFGSGED